MLDHGYGGPGNAEALQLHRVGDERVEDLRIERRCRFRCHAASLRGLCREGKRSGPGDGQRRSSSLKDIAA